MEDDSADVEAVNLVEAQEILEHRLPPSPAQLPQHESVSFPDVLGKDGHRIGIAQYVVALRPPYHQRENVSQT